MADVVRSAAFQMLCEGLPSFFPVLPKTEDARLEYSGNCSASRGPQWLRVLTKLRYAVRVLQLSLLLASFKVFKL